MSGQLKTVSIFILIVCLSGCFWESGPPDFFEKERVSEIVVIWDQKVSHDAIQRLTWSESDRELIDSLISNLEPSTWKPVSVLPAGHDTRIILVLNSGVVWEIMPSISKSRRSLSSFNRQDTGWTGRIRWSQGFIDALTAEISKATEYDIDLTSQYRIPVMEGDYQKEVSDLAQSMIERFPGYPEIRWNKSAGQFEYLE